MRQVILFLIFIPFFKKSLGQDSIHVTRQYENDTPITNWDSGFNKLKNVIYIYLKEGFNDSVRVTVNGIVLLDKYLQTNESIDYADNLLIHFNDSTEVKELRINFMRANKYILERLNLKYKSLQIRGLKPWLLIYTNRFPRGM